MNPILHVLSKNGMFLFRFNNGEFGSKWCGIWKKDWKYFDYFAFNINNEFLSEANFKEFALYNSQFSTLSFQHANGKVLEEVKCYDDSVLVSVTPSFEAEISTEFGINIRRRDEDYQKGKRYNLMEIKNGIKAELNGNTAYVYFLKGEFKREEYYGIHSPGKYAMEKGLTKYLDRGEIENKYVPGTINVKVKENETFDIVFSVREIDFDSLYKMIKNKIKYAEEYGEIIKLEGRKFDIDIIDRNFMLDSVDAIYSYANFNEKEIYAGFPYFNEFWLRDALIIMPSFLSLNNFAFVKDLLIKIMNMIDEKGLPNKVNSQLYPKDVLGLFLIDMYEYLKYTNDSSVVDRLEEKIDTILKTCKSWMDGNHIHDKGKETWMDSIDREYSVEIQAIWIKALESVYLMYKNKEAKEMHDILIKGMDDFFTGEYLTDQKDKKINSANEIFALFFDVVDENKKRVIIQNVKNEMLTENGILSVSKNDKTFDFNGYQNGAIWPLLTEMFMGILFREGESELGKQLLSVLKNNKDMQCSSRINEIIRPDGKPKGCPSQAWSISLIPAIIDKYILGINVDVPNGEIHIKKQERINAKRNLNLSGKKVEIELINGSIKSNYGVREFADEFIIEL